MGKGISEADFESFELTLEEFPEEIIDGFSDQPDLLSCFHNSQIISKASDDPTELIFCNTVIPIILLTHSNQTKIINIIIRDLRSTANDFQCLMILVG